jgi:gamma-glutamylcysteine synthetase
MDLVYRHFMSKFEQAAASRSGDRRIGAELKFPLVNPDGTAASLETVRSLWSYLCERGWEPVKDTMAGAIVGASKPGEQNHTVASCETGFCKVEFSLAHVRSLFKLEEVIHELQDELRPLAKEHNVHFLGYGIQPISPPSKRLLMKKTRTSVWDKVFPSNRHVAKKDGDDVHLFTINAASHVHVSVTRKEAIPAVNVLNGFAGAQIALTANSNIWLGRIDPEYKCVAEKFWDWWMPESNRVGVPQRPFNGVKDYVQTIASFRPVYVKRADRPIVMSRYASFAEYYCTGRAVGFDADGREVSFVPEESDIDLHNTCYWFDARLSRYCTVENRVNDQQPPADLSCVAALTLGLVSALPEASRELSRFHWNDLRTAREIACRFGLGGSTDTVTLSELARSMLWLATVGLRRRGLGEEQFLAPLWKRLSQQTCPADEAAQLFSEGGIEALVKDRRL